MDVVKFKIALLCALAITLSSRTQAALSGYWESSKILHAVLGDSNVADALKQQPIEFISRTQSGYTIKSRDCTVDVYVDQKTASNLGSGDWTVRIGKSDCR